MMRLQRRITKSYFNLACRQYAPLIQKLAFRIGTNRIQVEELKARALEELLKCMICYDKRGSFITFFHGRLVDIFRHTRDAEFRAKRIQHLSLDSMSHIVGPDDNIDFRMMAQEYMTCLDKDEKNIILAIFFSNQTMRQVSDNLGIVPSTVCRIKTRAIDKMRQKYQVELI